MPFSSQGFADAIAESQTGDSPPDAIYDAELVASDIATRRSDGAQWVKFTWKVVSGAHRDAQWDSLHTLERFKPDGDRNPGLVFTVNTLRSMGLDVENTHYGSDVELKRALVELEGHGYSVEIKTNGQFTNTYVKDRLASYVPSLPGSGTPQYGQPRNGPTNAIMGHDGGGTSAPPQTLAQAGAPERRDVERTGESDVTTPADVAAFDRSTAPKRGDVDPETGEEIPF